MCKRFALWVPPGTISRYFKVSVPVDLRPRYNIAPGQKVLAVRQIPDHPRDAAHFQWGFIPAAAGDESIGRSMTCARAETVSKKPEFREAFRARRCIIPASGYYEWENGSESTRPFLVRPKGADFFAFAGLWETWNSPGTREDITSCSIITTQANDALSRVNERMPVIIGFKDFSLWLDPYTSDEEKLALLMKPWPSEQVTFYQVDAAVNDPSNDYASLIEPAEGRQQEPFST